MNTPNKSGTKSAKIAGGRQFVEPTSQSGWHIAIGIEWSLLSWCLVGVRTAIAEESKEFGVFQLELRV